MAAAVKPVVIAEGFGENSAVKVTVDAAVSPHGVGASEEGDRAAVELYETWKADDLDRLHQPSAYSLKAKKKQEQAEKHDSRLVFIHTPQIAQCSVPAKAGSADWPGERPVKRHLLATMRF